MSSLHDCRRAECNPAPKSLKSGVPLNGLAFSQVCHRRMMSFLIEENHRASKEFLS